MNASKQNFRNVLALLIAQAVAAGAGIFGFVRIGTIFDVSELGRFGFAASSTVLFGLLAELGVRYIAIKEIALDPTRARIVFRHSVIVRFLLSMFALGLLVLCSELYPPWHEETTLLFLAGLGSVTQFGAEPVSWVFFGRGRVDIGAAILVIDRLLYVVMINAFALVFRSAEWLLIALFVANLLRSVIAWFWMRPTLAQEVPLQRRWDSDLFVRMIREGMAIGIAVLVSVSYLEISIIVAQTVTTPDELGYYAVALGLVQVFLIVPMALTNALFPALAALTAGGKLEELYRTMLRLTLIMVVPLGVGIFTFAGPLLTLWAGGRYEQATLILRILAVGMIASAYNYLYRIFLFAQNRPWVETLIDLLGVVVITVAGGIAGVAYGALGIAVVFSILEIVLLIIKFATTLKWLGVPPDLGSYGRGFLAAIIPALVTSLLPLSTAVEVILYGISCGGLMIVLGVIPVGYWKTAISQVRNLIPQAPR